MEKSTTSPAPRVMVRLAAAMSPRPSSSAGISSSRDTGMKKTWNRKALVFSCPVRLVLEALERIIGDPTLGPFVDKVERTAGDDEHAQDAPLDDAIPIAFPRTQAGRDRDRAWCGGLRWHSNHRNNEQDREADKSHCTTQQGAE